MAALYSFVDDVDSLTGKMKQLGDIIMRVLAQTTECRIFFREYCILAVVLSASLQRIICPPFGSLVCLIAARFLGQAVLNHPKTEKQMLEVKCLAPRARTIISVPSAEHMRLLGASEGVFTASDDALFMRLFLLPQTLNHLGYGDAVCTPGYPAFSLSSPFPYPLVNSWHPLDFSSPLRCALDACAYSLPFYFSMLRKDA